MRLELVKELTIQDVIYGVGDLPIRSLQELAGLDYTRTLKSSRPGD